MITNPQDATALQTERSLYIHGPPWLPPIQSETPALSGDSHNGQVLHRATIWRRFIGSLDTKRGLRVCQTLFAFVSDASNGKEQF